MRGEASRSPLGDERGVVVVITSLLVVALMTIAAIVVDLGQVRSTRRTVQSIADLSALAGGEHLAVGNGVEACEAAVRYLRLNTAGMTGGASVPCTQLSAVCGWGTSPATVTDGGTAAPYSISVTYPVADADIKDPRVPGGVREDDGWKCERMRVTVKRTNKGLFAGIVGVRSLSARASAVARRVPYAPTRIPNLWLLDPHRCNALLVRGGSIVTVGSTDPAIGGLIALDSDGAACSGSEWTIDVHGSTTRVRAIPDTVYPPGQITLVALRAAQRLCSDPGNPHACQQTDVDEGRMHPQPLRRDRPATRALVDHLYNCKASYPPYATKVSGMPAVALAPCPAAGERPAYVDQLRSAMAAGPTTKADTSNPPSGFQRWTDHYACDQPVVPAALTGNWWIDCALFRTTKNQSVTFAGGNLVFTGDVLMEGGSLKFNDANPTASLPSGCEASTSCWLNQSSAQASYIYMRDGDFVQTAHGTVVARNTAVIQEKGFLDLRGQAGPVWSSPKQGPFRGLSLWSELESSSYYLAGGASLDLEGIFFVPEADHFQLAGSFPQRAQRAQFIARRLDISGSSELTLVPLPGDFVPLPPPAAILIR